MAKITKAGQKRHDESVLRSVRQYEDKKYNVKADLPDYEKPKTIGGYIPDWITKKGKKEIIGEVETKGSNEKDKEQQEAFKEYAERKGAREFKKKIV